MGRSEGKVGGERPERGQRGRERGREIICTVELNSKISPYHSQRSSESTVPTKPFTSNSVHTSELGNSSTSSFVKCHSTRRGERRTTSNRPTKPGEIKAIIL